MLHYLKIWLASARYSVVRTMMFRFDFLLWSTVELMWMSVNLLLVTVIYAHTDNIAGWTKYEMMLLVGTAMLLQRFMMGFFWSSLFELARNIRSGYFDFFLAQPGNIMFMATTRKLDLDGVINCFVALAVVVYSAGQLHLHPTFTDILMYTLTVGCGVLIHYSAMLTLVSLGFWITNAQGLEGSYFTLFEFSRLPREAFKGITRILFVWTLPVVIVSNVPAQTLLHGFDPTYALWLLAATVFWFGLATLVFHRGLRNYSSASS
ncbi:MAG: ABC-2 family transporter protein [Cephaloticoccus sp.]|nr:ABC-2 family transporter protein [Cephaloticoccus sp.]MCF7761201.1 ABC-2 family transporter protein [Cephaloticoccus sp.]